MSLRVEWDPKKEKKNLKKHQVSFEEARAVFKDPLSRTVIDEENSFGEERWIVLGHSKRGRLIVVIYTERSHNRARIISARLATKKERSWFEEI